MFSPLSRPGFLRTTLFCVSYFGIEFVEPISLLKNNNNNNNNNRNNNFVDFSVNSEAICETTIKNVAQEKLFVQFPNIYRPKTGTEHAIKGEIRIGGERGSSRGSVSGGSGSGKDGENGKGVGGVKEIQSSHYSLELIRLSYLPLVYTCGKRRRVPLSVQHVHVGSRIDFNVTSDVNPAATCLGANGCIFDRLLSFPFDSPFSPVRWQSQPQASYNPLSVFPSSSEVVDVKHCANREGWRRSQGYIPCVAAVIEPWFWMSHQHETQWRDAVNCGYSDNNNDNHNSNHNNNQFCCICAPDSGDGASICGGELDVAAEVRHFSTNAECTRDERRLGQHGTFGACPYKCACGKADEMRRKCSVDLRRDDLDDVMLEDGIGRGAGRGGGRGKELEFEAAAVRSAARSEVQMACYHLIVSLIIINLVLAFSNEHYLI